MLIANEANCRGPAKDSGRYKHGPHQEQVVQGFINILRFTKTHVLNFKYHHVLKTPSCGEQIITKEIYIHVCTEHLRGPSLIELKFAPDPL